MSQEKLYIDKEFSWLSFNERILQEAADKSNPLIERMRFLGIYANNLEEFYKVRFADLKRRLLISEAQGTQGSSRHLLKKIQANVLKAGQEFDQLYNELMLEMARNQIFLLNERQLSEKQKIWLHQYYKNHLRRYIIPIMLEQDTHLLSFLKDDYTYLAVEILREQQTRYALLEIPSDKVGSFIILPSESSRRSKSLILVDNILRHCLDDIFKGFFDYHTLNAYSMKMTRDAEYDLGTEMESSLMELMSSSLKQRLTAKPVRFIYQREMPDTRVRLLREKLGISSYDSVIAGGRYHNFKDFIQFPNISKTNLLNKPLPCLRHQGFHHFRNSFDAIRHHDLLLYYPYHTVEHVLEVLRQAINAQEFVRRATQVIPYPIEIISGHEEARLIFMGVAHTQPGKGKKLVIDIGGGSTEITIGKDFSPLLIESRRMGCISFSLRVTLALKIFNALGKLPIKNWSISLGNTAPMAGNLH